MVLEVIAGAILLAFGLVSVYFTIEKGKDDQNFQIILLLGIAAVIAGGWILISTITLAVLFTKVAGIVLIIAGFFMAFQFPDITDYQPENMGKTGIFIGLILLILGIYLLFFA